METLPIDRIKPHVEQFFGVVKSNPDKHFLITAIGCGFAGYSPKQIAPLFRDFLALENVSLPEEFLNALTK